ncbi:hypothetical protein IV38_GL000861 [Lactobacillus selangorensis]|uniref:WxL domain-containing protein n=1 Tax=Lactobacillus selangorensis TaxID=81857 RepID=A0A0R2FJ15_9LACO|nr:hypothetical protein [Lactobacillus selangorensis]KRN28658.1 hypothetical protein IV38_GL000861 [Lactobacillus selangorensis]KRN32932.1 hypothetical protein IV40_GL000992 [Lactobacillus selangorensis]
MKVPKYLLLLTLMLLCQTSQPVAAASNSTSVKIAITPQPLEITSTTVPKFSGRIHTDQTQTLVSRQPLTIKVNDQRTRQTNPWMLRYQISAFKNGTHSLGNEVHLKIGPGLLTTSAPADYQAQSLNLLPGQTQELVQAQTQPDTSEYQVAADAITLEIPANAQAGQYQALQTITLLDVPNV